MRTVRNRARRLVIAIAWLMLIVQTLRAEWPAILFMPEQRTIEVRDPAEMPPASVLHTPPPPTISDSATDLPSRPMSLDESIRTALSNAEIVRVLGGVTAVSSGSSIYDAAVTNTFVDDSQARFDPIVQVQNSWNRLENPQAVFTDPAMTMSGITGLRSDNYNVNTSVSKTNTFGGTASLNLNTGPTFTQPGTFPLNPQTTSSLGLQLTQPLLQGAGRRTNLAPIVLARIDTERSYFQFKDSVQELVRGVIEAYWSVVFARTDVWARQQQVKQADFAYQRTLAAFDVGSADVGEVAQAKTALANFRATLLTSRASLLQREAAYRNLLGFPAFDQEQIVPVTPPVQDRLEMDWEQILSLAEQNRPDLIELKLVLEADQQLLFQANNNALPRADAVALYRWNGIEGEMPIGTNLSSGPGQFTDWTLGVNFSVPMGLRQSRAALRRRELITSRDRANLNQGLHSAAHELALSLRNLAQFYEQYKAFTEVREAAETNLNLQLNEYRGGRQNFLVVLLAITDWGNAVSSQAQTLLQYNTELATLERRTGTILETHGVRFVEERFGSVSPLGRIHRGACYPLSLPPTMNFDRYESGTHPAEQSFDLYDPVERSRMQRGRPEELPRPNAPTTPPPPTPSTLRLRDVIR
jgi:outer membrane protein TolC